jgi:hypothetical protein
VSPVNASAREGNSENLFPWANYACPRYMQIHDDLVGAPKSILELAFRMDARHHQLHGGEPDRPRIGDGAPAPRSRCSSSAPRWGTRW